MNPLLNKYHQFDLRIRECNYGRGVFAGKNFKRGELLEVCPLLVLDKYAAELAWIAHGNIFERYYFDYNDQYSAIALGYGSLYNHSKNPNATYSINTDSNELVIYALKNIKKDSQVFINYGYDPLKRF
jgi:hypothetical protein